MKRLLSQVLILVFLAQGCKSTKSTSQAIRNIQIAIEQDGKLIKPSKGVIELKKEAFDLIFEMPKNSGVFVNLSYSDSTSKLTLQGKVPSVFDNRNVIAVDLFNRESTLYVTDDSINVSYYTSDEEHTFNEIAMLNGGHRGARTVTKMYDLNTSTSYEIKDISESIYLTFAGVNHGEQEAGTPFLIGQNFKIIWTD